MSVVFWKSFFCMLIWDISEVWGALGAPNISFLVALPTVCKIIIIYFELGDEDNEEPTKGACNPMDIECEASSRLLRL